MREGNQLGFTSQPINSNFCYARDSDNEYRAPAQAICYSCNGKEVVEVWDDKSDELHDEPCPECTPAPQKPEAAPATITAGQSDVVKTYGEGFLDGYYGHEAISKHREDGVREGRRELAAQLREHLKKVACGLCVECEDSTAFKMEDTGQWVHPVPAYSGTPFSNCPAALVQAVLAKLDQLECNEIGKDDLEK